MVLELYGLVLERYKGLYTLGRWAMYGAILVSGAVSILTLLPKIAPSTPEPSKRLFVETGHRARCRFRPGYLHHIDRVVLIEISGATEPQRRRSYRHLYGLLPERCLGPAMANSARAIIAMTPLMHRAGYFRGLFGGLVAMLSAKGEEVRAPGPQLRADSEERILQQLDLLNATLLKVSRK